MKIGMTTFGFRHLIRNPSKSPSLDQIVRRARTLGFDALQVCENARPMELRGADWDALMRSADDAGIEIQLGCKTIDLRTLKVWADRAADLPSRMLRLVLEQDNGHRISRGEVDTFLAGAIPILEANDLRLAIENHFDVSSQVLAEVVAPYPPERIGFCVDTANSLRNFESTAMVLDLLGDRAFCCHVKDYNLEGYGPGFRVTGALLGQGELDLELVIARMLACDPVPQIFVEHWRTGIGDWEADVSQDDFWLRHSRDILRAWP